MTRIALLIAVPVALLAASACSPSSPPPPPPPEAVEPLPAPSADAGDLDAARAAWEARGPASYAYTLGISCFCLHRGEYAVEVRDGRVASVRAVDTGEPASEEVAALVPSVDGLFTAIADAAAAGRPVRATYHPELGYPTEAEVGLLADDSGTLYTIAGLRTL